MPHTLLPDTIHVLERGWLSSNNILLFDDQAATLIDTGYVGHTEQTIALVKSALAARPGTVRLERILNTHSHSDHIGGNFAVQAALGGAILVPAGIEEMIRHWDADALLLTAAKQRADRFAHHGVIKDQQTLQMGGLDWQALPAPGHDMAALVYYCAERRILISGDALWEDGFGIIFGELMGSPDALPATRATLEMISRLAVDVVIPGHGAPFTDVDAALTRAFQRLAAFEADTTRLGRNAVRACFTFNLLDLQRLHQDEFPAYLHSVPMFTAINQRVLGYTPDDFAAWLLADLLRSGVVELNDGWIVPRVAP